MTSEAKIISLGAALLLAGVGAQAQTITDWNFDAAGVQAAPDNSPAPSTGTGTATVLGMNNDYNDGGSGNTIAQSIADADVLATAGASTGSGSYAWRIRGGSLATVGTPNGWSTNAPIGTQGAGFATSTAGYNNVKVSFDLFTTSAAEANVLFLYTLNGTTWNDATLSYTGTLSTSNQVNSTSANTYDGAYLQLKQSGGGWYNDITAALPAGAANDTNFAFEIVNASTGSDDVNQTDGVYNNNSGNWRFDNVDITGNSTTAPVPDGASTLALLGSCLGAMGGVRFLMRRHS